VEQLFSSPAGDWSEPVRSGLGWHLVKITAVQPVRVLPFDSVLPDVRAAWLHEATSRARRERFDHLRARYHVAARRTAE
jgi:parvulin-like peptidyl-prolyl isomerase